MNATEKIDAPQGQMLQNVTWEDDGLLSRVVLYPLRNKDGPMMNHWAQASSGKGAQVTLDGCPGVLATSNWLTINQAKTMAKALARVIEIGEAMPMTKDEYYERFGGEPISLAEPKIDGLHLKTLRALAYGSAFVREPRSGGAVVEQTQTFVSCAILEELAIDGMVKSSRRDRGCASFGDAVDWLGRWMITLHGIDVLAANAETVISASDTSLWSERAVLREMASGNSLKGFKRSSTGELWLYFDREPATGLDFDPASLLEQGLIDVAEHDDYSGRSLLLYTLTEQGREAVADSPPIDSDGAEQEEA